MFINCIFLFFCMLDILTFVGLTNPKRDWPSQDQTILRASKGLGLLTIFHMSTKQPQVCSSDYFLSYTKPIFSLLWIIPGPGTQPLETISIAQSPLELFHWVNPKLFTPFCLSCGSPSRGHWFKLSPVIFFLIILMLPFWSCLEAYVLFSWEM